MNEEFTSKEKLISYLRDCGKLCTANYEMGNRDIGIALLGLAKWVEEQEDLTIADLRQFYYDIH